MRFCIYSQFVMRLANDANFVFFLYDRIDKVVVHGFYKSGKLDWIIATFGSI